MREIKIMHFDNANKAIKDDFTHNIANVQRSIYQENEDEV